MTLQRPVTNSISASSFSLPARRRGWPSMRTFSFISELFGFAITLLQQGERLAHDIGECVLGQFADELGFARGPVETLDLVAQRDAADG